MLVLRVVPTSTEGVGGVMPAVGMSAAPAQSDLAFKESILDKAFAGQLTEIVRMGVSPQYQGLLGPHVWLAPNERLALKKWREKGDIAFIPEELPIIIPLILESSDQAMALLETKRRSGTFITTESPGQDNGPEIYHIQNGEELESIHLYVKENSVNKVFIDTETTGLDPYAAELVLVQIMAEDQVFVINVKSVASDHPGFSILRRLLEDQAILKIGHNLKFDIKFFKQQLFSDLTIRNLFDTYLAESLLTAGLADKGDLSLKALAKKYLGLELDKAQRSSFAGQEISRSQIDYAVKDVEVLEPIFRQQSERLVAEGLVDAALLEFSIVSAVADMELAGMLLDLSKLGSLKKTLEAKLVELEGRLHDLAGEKEHTLFGDTPKINFRSPVQVKELFAKLGISLESTGIEVLSKTDHPLARTLVEHRKVSKLLSSFIKPLPDHISKHTGRIHPDFYQTGTEAGRFTCENPNVQQIPKEQEWRDLFTAPLGYRILTADYNQIELRILAEFSQDPAFLDAYHQGQDLHSRTAAEMFRVPLEQVTKEQRDVAKTINFGLCYGMSAKGLAARLNIDAEQAEKFIQAYFRAYPRVKDTLQRLGIQAVRRHYSETLSGRKRYYRPADGFSAQKSLERKGRNTPIQGTCGDILKKAVHYLMEALGPYDARIINLVHDEIVIEVVEHQATAVKEIVTTQMVRACKDFLKTIPVEVDLVIDQVWRK
jgi:DNA polymerase-1